MYGVWCTTDGNGVTEDYALYAEGDTYTTGGDWDASDEMFKTDITDLENALNLINQLEPKSYNYLTEEFERYNFPEESQMGLIAQDIEQVLPNLVTDVTAHAIIDSLGNTIAPTIVSKAVNYKGLIPLLIQGIKEQQAMIEQLQADVDACCAGQNFKQHEIEEREELRIDGFELFQNVPNPFKQETRIDYTITEPGRAKLIIQNEAGQLIKVAFEETVSEGRYQYNWNTVGLPSGVYYYSLFMNDIMQLKKAIKL